MGANVEIKARIRDLARTRRLVAELGSAPAETIVQEDIFFHSDSGRIKLRILRPDRGELIAYTRPDGPGPKRSDYRIYPTRNPGLLRDTLSAVWDERGAVRKRRELTMAGNTRIHVDRVEHLGDFLELEVVLAPGEAEEEGRLRARELLARLEIPAEDLVDVAYIDLLERGAQRPGETRGDPATP